MDQQEPKRNWKKILITSAVVLIVPGGLIGLGMYGIKKLWDRKNRKDVSTKGPEERTISDS